MTGTEGQIKWANSIKSVYNNKLDDLPIEIQNVFLLATEKINSSTDAKWFIDNRIKIMAITSFFDGYVSGEWEKIPSEKSMRGCAIKKAIFSIIKR